MKYRHLFFDLDHTLWDFETNAKESLLDVFATLALKERGVPDFDSFFNRYSYHNHRLWEKYTRGLQNCRRALGAENGSRFLGSVAN
jgi:putative hydrolase of the HAD superfamily